MELLSATPFIYGTVDDAQPDHRFEQDPASRLTSLPENTRLAIFFAATPNN
jgi:hypothetical protein